MIENKSASTMWGDFLKTHLDDVFHEVPDTIHFCDNEEDANICAELVKKNVKKATSDSLLGLQYRKKKLPKIGDFHVITDWQGEAQCIIQTTKVRLKPFFSIDEEYAKLEGEGDKSLKHWKESHWNYYSRELEAFDRKPRESMIIVCQEFVKVFER